MDWMFALVAILGGLVAAMAIGIPVAFAFIFVTAIAVGFLQQGGSAFQQVVLNVYASVSSFALVPVPLFIFMGVVLWHSNLGQQAIDAIDKWLGRLPGRLALLTIGSGAVFSALSGSTMANCAMLGTMLQPDMERRGYSRHLAMGSIMAAGGLAMMIPPSALAVIFATIGRLSIGGILVACVVPGLMMAAFYAGYVIGRCALQPQIAPHYDVASVAWTDRIVTTVRDLVPLGVVIFSVTGLIVIGVATPNEAAALGALSSLLLALFYRRMTWQLLVVALRDTMRISVMSFAIVATATSYSQILAFSGATRGLLEAVLAADLPPLVVIIGMQLIVMLLGCFMEQIAIMLITLPIFMPIVIATGFDPIWFGVIMLVNLETALMTPPFGMLLFVMKGVAPAGTTFRQVYIAALPFIVCNVIVMVLLLAFPQLVTSVAGWAKP